MLEETEEFKRALKLVIKRQMRHLMEQLKEGGEEVVILSVNMMNKTCSHFGSTAGEWFISEQENLTNNFLNFCITHSKVNKGKASANRIQSPSVARDQTLYQLSLPQGSACPASTDVSMSASTPVFSTPVKHALQTGQRTLAVSIPKSMTVGISEKELAGFVGRVVAAQMSGKKKQKDLVQATVSDDMNTQSLVSQSPPAKRRRSTQGGISTRSTRSGRKVSTKFLESMNTLKSKHGKGKAGNTSFNKEEDTDLPGCYQTEDATETVKQLEDLDPEIVSRVEVTVDGKWQDITSATMRNVGSLRKVVLPILSELSQESTNLHDVRTVQVAVDTESKTGRVAVSYAKQTLKVEEEVEEEDADLADNDCGEDVWVENPEDETDPDFEPSTNKDVGLRVNKACSTLGVHKPLPPQKKKQKKSSSYIKPVYERIPMPCDLCGISIIGKSNLKSHIRRIHLGQMDHKCEVCNKLFWSAKRRDTHKMAVHTRKCDSCQNYVVESVPWEPGTNMRSRRDVLCTCGAIVSIFSTFGRRKQNEEEIVEEGNQTPIRQNDDGTKYACGTCGKLFIEKTLCERHARGHFSIKSCVCEICGSAFTYENSLRKHKIKEHGQEGLFCKYCNKNYSNSLTLKVHVSRVHGKEAIEDLAKYRNSQDGNTEDETQETLEVAANEKDDKMQPQVIVKKMRSVFSSRASSVKTKTGLGKGGKRRNKQMSESSQMMQTTYKQEGMMETDEVETEAAAEQIVLTSEEPIEHIVVSEQGHSMEVGHLVITSVQESGAMVSEHGVIADSQVVVCEESFVNSLRNSQVISEEGGVSIIVKQVD